MLRPVALGAFVAIAAMATGCTTPGATDKLGSDTLVLRLATIDGQTDSSGQGYAAKTFVDALSDISNGRIQADVTYAYGGETATGESRLVKAIAGGEVDGGWPSTRAFAASGIPGLAAIEAPLVITSYTAQAALADGPGAETALAALDGTGIHGLGLAVGPLRRPFGVKDFFLSAEDWRGASFRAFNSPVQSAAIAALGGTPVQAGTDWPSLVGADRLDGLEYDVAQYLANGFTTQAGHVTANVVLWPEMAVLAINEDRWAKLTEQQRDWVTGAAEQAVQASIDGEYSDSELAEELCDRGVRFERAQPSDLLWLANAVPPVLDELAADPEEAPLLRQVLDAGRLHNVPDTITVPDSCNRETEAADSADIPETFAPIPDGFYRKTITEAEVADADLTNNDGISGTWTLEVDAGRWYLSCRPVRDPGADCGHTVSDDALDAGWLYGDEEVVWLVHDPGVLAERTGCLLPADNSPEHCESPLDPMRLDWSIEGDELNFRANRLFIQLEMVLKPYVRID